MTLKKRLVEQAHALGFDRVGVAPAAAADHFDHLTDWLAQGFAGTMDYLTRHEEARRHPSAVLPNVRSVVMVALSYAPARPEAPPPPGWGRVARYSQGADYHDVLRTMLNALVSWLQAEVPGSVGRGVVDTAPLLERDFARRAGLGWVGKNTMLIDKRLGSFTFLGALLTDVALEPDAPHKASHCGTCTACLDACPTDAFPAPGVLDARRCLSYLTIELKGDVPDDLRPAMDDWLFGCDVCQDVCPWNRKPPPGRSPDLAPRADLVAVDLVELLSLSEEAFRRRFKGTALWRTRRRGLLRNAALIVGNRGDVKALPALRMLCDDPEPAVRAAARWAVARLASSPPGSTC